MSPAAFAHTGSKPEICCIIPRTLVNLPRLSVSFLRSNMQKGIILFLALTIFSTVFATDVIAAQEEISEIVALASQILKVAMLMDKPRSRDKRNHGLIDTIINLPDLDKIGKK